MRIYENVYLNPRKAIVSILKIGASVFDLRPPRPEDRIDTRSFLIRIHLDHNGLHSCCDREGKSVFVNFSFSLLSDMFMAVNPEYSNDDELVSWINAMPRRNYSGFSRIFRWPAGL